MNATTLMPFFPAGSSDPPCGMNRDPETPSSMLARLREGQAASSSSNIIQGPGSGGSNHGVTGASSSSQLQQQSQKSPRGPSKRGRPPSSSGGTPKKTTPRKLTHATQPYSLPTSPLSRPSGSLDSASENKLLTMELVREAQAAAELDLENAALRDTVDRLRGAEYRREMTSRHSAQVATSSFSPVSDFSSYSSCFSPSSFSFFWPKLNRGPGAEPGTQILKNLILRSSRCWCRASLAWRQASARRRRQA